MRKITTTETQLNEKEVALYIDKYGELTSTSYIERAFKYGTGGKALITDECGNDKGRPIFNGIAVDVYGAGEGYVYLSKEAREKDYRYVVSDNTYKAVKGVSIHHKTLTNSEQEAYKIANEFYMLLK